MKAKIIEWSNKLLAVFNKMVMGLKLTDKVLNKFPSIGNLVTPEELTLILTVLVGIGIILVIYGVLINISKFTLNFLVFAKWATVIILVSSIIVNMFGL